MASQINLAASATTAQGGAFTETSTWAGGVAPSVDADVVINNAVTSDSRTFNGDAVIGADGSLTAAGCVYVGHSNDGVAKLTINGGDNVFSGKEHNKFDSSLIIGYEGGVGKFILNDGTVTTSGYTYIGYTTTAGSEFIQNGGTFNSGDNIGLAYYANEVGSMLITDGEMNVNGGIRIGLGANSTGQMTVSGGNVTTVDFELGHADSGDAAKLEITGGVVEVTGAVYGAKNANSGNLYVSGTGQLVFNSTVTSNGIRELSSFQIEGSGADGTGALLFKQSLTSATPITLTGNTTIGVEPGAKFTQTAAITELSGTSCGLTVTGGGTMEVTANSTYTGATNVTGATLQFSSDTLPVSAMTASTGGTLVLGTEGNTINVQRGSSIIASGGTVRVDGDLTFVSDGTGSVVCDGSWTGDGSITLSGGTIAVGTNFNTTTGIIFNGGTIVNNENDATLSSDVTIVKDGSIMRTNSKTLTLTGKLKGSASLTIGSDNGHFQFCGDGSQYTGALLVQGIMRIGKNKKDVSDSKQFIGSNTINLDGGTIKNYDNHVTITNDINVMSASGIKTAWEKDTTLTGKLTGSGDLTVVVGTNGHLQFCGDGSKYTGSLLVQGNMRIGKNQEDVADSSQFIGANTINLDKDGIIKNYDNNIVITNDLNVMDESGFKVGWSKSITLEGNVTGSGKLKQVSSTGWLIIKTHSEGDTFTGPVQTGWASTSSRGQMRLAAEQPYGANVGTLYNFGHLDMNGFSQIFKGITNSSGKVGKLYNTTDNTSTLTLDITSQDLTYWGTIESNVALIVKADGTGTQTLTIANTYTGGTTISGGTLKLTEAGTLGTGPVTVNENGTVEIAYDAPTKTVNIASIEMAKTSAFKVPSGTVTFSTADVALNNLSGGSLNESGQIAVSATLTVTGKLTLNNDQLTKFIGSITAPIVEKTGLDTLQLCFDAQNAVNIGSLVVSSGRVDLKGYMQGGITVNDGIFSPGNSIGEATFGGGFILNEVGSMLLMEIGGTDAADNDQLTASLTDTRFASGSIVQFALDSESNYTPSLGDVIEVTMPEVNWNDVTFSSYYFTELGYDGTRGVQLLGVNPNAVPEPSTWALLALGVVVLFLRKRVRN